MKSKNWSRGLGCVAALLVAAPALGGCKAKELLACPVLVASERADESDTRMLPHDVWFSVLVKQMTRYPDLRPPESPLTCNNTPISIRWPSEQVKAVDSRSSATQLATRALGEADLTYAEVGVGELLIWARIGFFADGTAIGPVALVRWVERGVEVRAIGTLRAPYERARLRLERLGDESQILVAESAVCGERRGVPCRREIYLMPLIERRFVSSWLVEY